jgi:hypothetical protein
MIVVMPLSLQPPCGCSTAIGVIVTGATGSIYLSYLLNNIASLQISKIPTSGTKIARISSSSWLVMFLVELAASHRASLAGPPLRRNPQAAPRDLRWHHLLASLRSNLA